MAARIKAWLNVKCRESMGNTARVMAINVASTGIMKMLEIAKLFGFLLQWALKK